jgi:hypothetical protein
VPNQITAEGRKKKRRKKEQPNSPFWQYLFSFLDLLFSVDPNAQLSLGAQEIAFVRILGPDQGVRIK